MESSKRKISASPYLKNEARFSCEPTPKDGLSQNDLNAFTESFLFQRFLSESGAPYESSPMTA